MNVNTNNARLAMIANAAQKIQHTAQVENTATETLECYRIEDVSDCVNFVREDTEE